MVDPNPIQSPLKPLPGVGSSSPAAPSKGVTSPENGAHFRALLDQLQTQVQGLQKTGESPLQADELAGAVDQARTSLEDALSLKDQLLEAYRAAQQRSETGESA